MRKLVADVELPINADIGSDDSRNDKKAKSVYYYNNIRFSRGAYFYKTPKKLLKTDITDVFSVVKKHADKYEELSCEIRKNECVDGKTLKCSFLLFYYFHTPNILAKDVEKYKIEEKRIAYLLIIEIDLYVVLVRLNANGITSFTNKLVAVSGGILTDATTDSNTRVNKVKLGSMSMNAEALRNRSYEGNDLAASIPRQGAGRSVLRDLRFENTDGITSVCTSTARVCQLGEKKSIHELCEWACRLTDKMKSSVTDRCALLDCFAQPVTWKKLRGELEPSSLLIDVHSLRNIREGQHLRMYFEQDHGQDEVELFYKILERLNRCLNLKHAKGTVYLCENTLGLLYVKKNVNDIVLYGVGNLSKIYVVDNAGISTKLISLINRERCFTVSFADVSFIYSGRQLYEDKKLMGDLDTIRTVLVPIKAMNGAKSEKGDITAASKVFSSESVFGVVEDYFKENGAENVICDDLGNEWADHLITTGDTLSFVHSKAGKRGLSASNFQEVIAQAIKNIGNMNSDALEGKVASFSRPYSNTYINRCRLGSTGDFIEKYRRINRSPNGRREICIAVNFLSYKELDAELNKKPADMKKSVIQLIWLLYSFISICRDANLGCRVLCCE